MHRSPSTPRRRRLRDRDRQPLGRRDDRDPRALREAGFSTCCARAPTTCASRSGAHGGRAATELGADWVVTDADEFWWPAADAHRCPCPSLALRHVAALKRTFGASSHSACDQTGRPHFRRSRCSSNHARQRSRSKLARRFVGRTTARSDVVAAPCSHPIDELGRRSVVEHTARAAEPPRERRLPRPAASTGRPDVDVPTRACTMPLNAAGTTRLRGASLCEPGRDPARRRRGRSSRGDDRHREPRATLAPHAA